MGIGQKSIDGADDVFTFDVMNRSSRPLKIILEPWAEEHIVEPKQELLVEARGTFGGHALTLVFNDGDDDGGYQIYAGESVKLLNVIRREK